MEIQANVTKPDPLIIIKPNCTLELAIKDVKNLRIYPTMLQKDLKRAWEEQQFLLFKTYIKTHSGSDSRVFFRVKMQILIANTIARRTTQHMQYVNFQRKTCTDNL